MAEQDTEDVQAKPKKKLPPYWVQLGAQVGGNPVDYTGLFGSKGIGAFLSAATVAGYALFGSIYAFANGTVIAPSQTWADEGTSGRYRVSAGVFAESVGGVQKMNWDATRLQLVSGYALDLAGMTSGSVAFWGAGGRFTQDNANFFWDNTIKQLCLGDGSATNPAYSWVSEPLSGIYRAAAGDFHFRIASSAKFRLTGSVLNISSTMGLGWSSAGALTGADVVLLRDAANVLALRNATTAQAFNVYNTFTDASNNERLEVSWSVVANTCVIRTNNLGTGTTRALQLNYGLTAVSALKVGTAGNGGLVFGRDNSTTLAASSGEFIFGNGIGRNATSGTNIGILLNHLYGDGGTNSTTVSSAFQISPTINYSAATKTGYVRLLHFGPTLTSIPTGNNAGISFSSALANASFPSMRWFNSADEVTDTEQFQVGWGITANTFVMRTANTGAGTQRGMAFQINATVLLQISAGGIITMGLSSTPSTSITMNTIRGGFTSTSGTSMTVDINGTYSDGGTNSSTVVYGLRLSPTVNYTAGTKTGSVYGVYLAPVLTSQPTGNNGGVVFSSSLASATFPATRWWNAADEVTNTEDVRAGFAVGTANIWTIGSFKAGTGTLRGIQIGVTGNAVGFLGAAPSARTAAYTITNPVARRTFDTTTVTLQQLAEAVGTVIADQQTFGLFG